MATNRWLDLQRRLIIYDLANPNVCRVIQLATTEWYEEITKDGRNK